MFRLTAAWSKKDDDCEKALSYNDDSKGKPQVNHRSTARTNDGKKAHPNKGKKQTHDNIEKETILAERSIDRTASESATGKMNVSRAYKRAQDTADRQTSDLQRSVSYSVADGTKGTDNKRLTGTTTGSQTGDKSRHDYDNVDGKKAHRYDNVELSEEVTASNSIFEHKYDKVDTEGAKKNRKQTEMVTLKNKSKEAADDRDHYYHTLEDSERFEQPPKAGINDEEYSSPKSKGLVVSKVPDKTGKIHVLSTEENATVKEAKGTESKRTKSYSGKKSKGGGGKKDHQYDEPIHNTLPSRSSAAAAAAAANATDRPKDDIKETSIQSGKLTSLFDDPMYLGRTEVSTEVSTVPSNTTQPAKAALSPKHVSTEKPVLRKTEQDKQSAKGGKDDHEYDEPKEKKSKLTKEAIYSSRLFDDPQYEGGYP